MACPVCGKQRAVRSCRRSSLDFCPTPGCDYPLFWAVPRLSCVAVDAAGTSSHRLPGAAGRQTDVRRPCPGCAEPDPPGRSTCLRCGGPMEPVVARPVPEVPAPPARRLWFPPAESGPESAPSGGSSCSRSWPWGRPWSCGSRSPSPESRRSDRDERSDHDETVRPSRSGTGPLPDRGSGSPRATRIATVVEMVRDGGEYPVGPSRAEFQCQAAHHLHIGVAG